MNCLSLSMLKAMNILTKAVEMAIERWKALRKQNWRALVTECGDGKGGNPSFVYSM